MNRTKLLWNIGFFFLLALSPQMTLAQKSQDVHISGSPNPVGSGARALGMGGAFIGVADDATAASWNPGGLIQLETPELSYVLSYDKLYEDRSFQVYPEASGEYSVSLYDTNYLSLAYPFNWLGRNMIVSLNYQTLYNFNKKHKYEYSYYNEETRWDILFVSSGPSSVKYHADGYLKALSPAIAVQLTQRFSLGITLNWYHPNVGSKWERDIHKYREFVTTADATPIERELRQSRSHEEYRFKTSLNPFGFKDSSYTMGFLWDINSNLTLGGVYKPQFTADVKYKEDAYSFSHTVDLTSGQEFTSIVPYQFNENQEMDMPASYGLGLAYRFSDQFSMDLDVYRTDWQDFVLRQADGRELSLITGQERRLADTDPTHQVRLGTEYLFLLKHKYAMPFRAGIFYDPEPTEDDPDDFYGISIGGGIAIGSFVFDMAYQFRWGNDVRKVILDSEEADQDVEQHTVYASVIYHF